MRPSSVSSWVVIWVSSGPFSACAAPAAVSEAPAAITAPAAIRATRIRVFFVMCCYPQ